MTHENFVAVPLQLLFHSLLVDPVCLCQHHTLLAPLLVLLLKRGRQTPPGPNQHQINPVGGSFMRDKPKCSGGELITSPPLNLRVGSSRPTMISAYCLRLSQHYQAQKSSQKMHVDFKQVHNGGSPRGAEQLVS